VALSDLTDPGALEHVQQRLRRLGVDRALVRAGVAEGDEVRVGEFIFTYEPDR
jgi:GTP-binding protein